MMLDLGLRKATGSRLLVMGNTKKTIYQKINTSIYQKQLIK